MSNKCAQPEKTNKSENFFRFFIPAQPSTKRSIYRRDGSTPSYLAYQRLVLPNGTSDIALWLSQPYHAVRLFGRLAHDVSSRFQRAILRSMRLCPMTDELNPAEMKIAVGYSPADTASCSRFEFPRARDSAVRHRVDDGNVRGIRFRSTELSLRVIRPCKSLTGHTDNADRIAEITQNTG